MTTPYEAGFDRSGMASLDELSTPRWQETFDRLESEQQRFLSKESEFRSPEYKWPRDALHNWSRVWEYPYVLHHLERWDGRVAGRPPRVMDLGSGVTFFPFAVNRLGFDVVCVDIDPVVGPDLARAATAMGAAPGAISFARTDGSRIPLEDGTLDAAYCISVLEHVDNPAGLVPEVARTLRPGGLFILTIDVAIEGKAAEIQPEKYNRLLSALREHFDYVHPEEPVHPRRMLTTDRGPYPIRSATKARDVARRLANGLLLNVLGVERGVRLGCHVFVLRKR